MREVEGKAEDPAEGAQDSALQGERLCLQKPHFHALLRLWLRAKGGGGKLIEVCVFGGGDLSGVAESLAQARIEMGIAAAELGLADAPGRPKQRSVNVEDNGMGDPLRFDAERLRILIERHLLFTGSGRARALLDNWDAELPKFVKIVPRDYRKALLDLKAEQDAAKTVAAE